MTNKRTKIDFSKHVHRVEIFKNEKGDEIQIDHFQVDDSNQRYIQFVNTDRFLTVSGDFGNWVFCRPFVPSPYGFVSDGYWLEKMSILSKQEPLYFDSEETQKEIKELIDGGLEEYGYEGERLKQAKDWYTDLLLHTEDDIEYYSAAYRSTYIPIFIDYEDIPCCKSVDPWLLTVFDAFDEICTRLKKDEI